MLLERFLTLLLWLPSLLLDLLPTVSLNNFEYTDGGIPISGGLAEGVYVLFGMIGYLLPIAALIPVIHANLVLDSVRIIVSIIVRVKSIIPFMPGG